MPSYPTYRLAGAVGLNQCVSGLLLSIASIAAGDVLYGWEAAKGTHRAYFFFSAATS
jgi:hypothetical protein